MITEQFVSFEVAKLLKEKWFNERTPASYNESGEFQDGFGRWNTTPIYYSASTQQMAMRWLREVHELAIEPYYYFPIGWCVDIKHINRKTDISEFGEVRGESYETYEEACEAACIYALKNLI